MDCDIITGGGPGLMQAANEGAARRAARQAQSVGIRVDLPFEQEVNAVRQPGVRAPHVLHAAAPFVLASDAFIVAPGGIGTVLETMMIWQLLQVRHLEDTPLILVGQMWPGLVEWARGTMLSADPPLASPEDLDIPRCVANGTRRSRSSASTTPSGSGPAPAERRREMAEAPNSLAGIARPYLRGSDGSACSNESICQMPPCVKTLCS